MGGGWWTTDRRQRQEVLAAVPLLPRFPYLDLDPPSEPGAYVLFLASRRLMHLGTMLATGQLPAYVGSGQRGLRDRLRRYSKSLAGMIEPDELHVSVLPTSSAATALYAESVLVEAWSPCFNSTSLGSKIPGRHRTNQQLGLVDALLGGRSWARDPTAVERARAHIQLVMRLARVPDDVPRWPPLITPAAPGEDQVPRGNGERGELRLVRGGGH